MSTVLKCILYDFQKLEYISYCYLLVFFVYCICSIQRIDRIQFSQKNSKRSKRISNAFADIVANRFEIKMIFARECDSPLNCSRRFVHIYIEEKTSAVCLHF